MQTMDHLLFSFPGIRVLLPRKTTPAPPPRSPGLLILLRESVPTTSSSPFGAETEDQFLRLQFFTASEYPDVDVRLDAHQEATKLDDCTFSIASPLGEAIKVIFPPLDSLVPQDDPRVDIPFPQRAATRWRDVVDTFEVEIDRWLTYRKDLGGDGGGAPREKGLVRSMTTPVMGGGGGGGGGSSAAGAGTAGGFAQYDPAQFADGKGGGGRLVLIDEEDGGEVGEVGGYQVRTIGVTAGSKEPVEVELPPNGEGPVTIRSPEYLRDAHHPAYANSTLVGTAATASRLIVTTSSYLAGALHSGATAYTKRTAPSSAPMTFNPNTHARVRQIHTLSTSAARISAVTLGQVSKHAQNLGARLAGKTADRAAKGTPANPGLLNKSLIAFSTIADGIDYAGRSLLGAGADATTAVVSHRYGEEAGVVARGLTGSVRNVGLVYIDAAGVSRRAVVKGVAKGMVVGKVRGGGEVIVPGPGMTSSSSSSSFGPGGTMSLPGTPLQGGLAPPPSYGSVQGTVAGAGQGQGQGGYYPPPPPTPPPPQGYAMRSVSPRPYEPSVGDEKSPAVMHGGYRY